MRHGGGGRRTSGHYAGGPSLWRWIRQQVAGFPLEGQEGGSAAGEGAGNAFDLDTGGGRRARLGRPSARSIVGRWVFVPALSGSAGSGTGVVAISAQSKAVVEDV